MQHHADDNRDRDGGWHAEHGAAVEDLREQLRHALHRTPGREGRRDANRDVVAAERRDERADPEDRDDYAVEETAADAKAEAGAEAREQHRGRIMAARCGAGHGQRRANTDHRHRRAKCEVETARQDDHSLRHGEESEVTRLLCDVEQICEREHAVVDDGEAEQDHKQSDRQYRAPQPLGRQQLRTSPVLGGDGQLDVRHGTSSVG